jgi:hypothetical protein
LLARSTRPFACGVLAFAAEMSAGRWRPASEILLSRGGLRIVNGAHRLSALILAGITVPFLVKIAGNRVA